MAKTEKGHGNGVKTCIGDGIAGSENRTQNFVAASPMRYTIPTSCALVERLN